MKKKKKTTIKDLEDCIKKKEEKIQDQDERIRGLERIQRKHKSWVTKLLWYVWVALCGIFAIIYISAGYYLCQYFPILWYPEGATAGIPSLGLVIIIFFIVMTVVLTWWILFKIFDGIEEML